MPKLKTAQRKKMKAKTFGLPDERKYPMPDKSHAANAKARATQMREKGKLCLNIIAAIDSVITIRKHNYIYLIK